MLAIRKPFTNEAGYVSEARRRFGTVGHPKYFHIISSLSAIDLGVINLPDALKEF
jgi:hypothetical protein